MENVAIKRADLHGILKLISRIRDGLDALQEELEIISDNELAGKIEEKYIGRLFIICEIFWLATHNTKKYRRG